MGGFTPGWWFGGLTGSAESTSRGAKGSRQSLLILFADSRAPGGRSIGQALSRMRHSDATLWVESALDDAVPMVRATAVAELRRLGSRSAIRKLVILARTDPDAGVRQAALMAAGADRLS